MFSATLFAILCCIICLPGSFILILIAAAMIRSLFIKRKKSCGCSCKCDKSKTNTGDDNGN